MAEQTQTAPTQADPKTTATNIAKGVHNKANGKAPVASESPITDPKAPETPPDPNAGKEKYVVDGKEVWLTPDERTKWIQKGMSFEPRMDELARLKQETLQLQRALLNDPGAVIENLAKQANIPVHEMVQRVLKGRASDDVKRVVGEWYYEEAVQPAKMTPEQLKAREDARWRQQREENDKRLSEQQIKLENQQKFQAALAHLRAQIGEALQESGLPAIDSPLGAEMATMVAKVMQLAERERRPMTPKQAIDVVKKRLNAFQQAYYDSLDEEGLAAQLRDENVKKIQKYLLKKAQGAEPSKPMVSKTRSHSRDRETINSDDFHDYLDELKKKG